MIGLLLFTIPLNGALFSRSAKLRHVYLTWQNDPCRTITINVHGINTPSKLTVYYDTQPRFSKISRYCHKAKGFGHQKIRLPDDRMIYHVELKDLIPGTTYYFTVGDQSRSYCGEIRFRTVPGETGPLLFVEGGDWENTPAAEALAKKAAALSPYAALLGGDYPSHVYGLGDYEKWDHWLDVYRRSMITPEGHLIPMVMAVGNHEVTGGFGQSKEKAPFFFHYFRQGNTKESYFNLTIGERVSLFVLDSGHAAQHDGPQLEWFEEQLEKVKEVPIKIAIYHVPLFPSIRFAKKDLTYRTFYSAVELWKGRLVANKLYSSQSCQGRKYWLPLFDKYNFTACFEHHDQTLKRTKLIREGKEAIKGTVYLGDGGWGSEEQHPPLQGYFNNYFAALQGKVHFFWAIEIDEDKITYVAMTPSGRVVDHFIQKR
ncbi:MAG: metallophosphoesterase family protein [Chlamydiales bacterium]